MGGSEAIQAVVGMIFLNSLHAVWVYYIYNYLSVPGKEVETDAMNKLMYVL